MLFKKKLILRIMKKKIKIYILIMFRLITKEKRFPLITKEKRIFPLITKEKIILPLLTKEKRIFRMSTKKN